MVRGSILVVIDADLRGRRLADQSADRRVDGTYFAYAAVPTPTEQTMFPVVRHSRVPKPAELRSWWRDG
jgi:hypothetical protein